MGFKQYIRSLFSILALMLISSIGLVYAQNYVPNPSFDNLKGKRPTLDPWRKVNTVDYFVNADDKRSKRRYNSRDDKNYTLRKPHSGQGYVGIRTWPKYREYIQVELIDTLTGGQKYYFEMYIVHSPYCSCYLKSIAASFYSKRPSYTSGNSIQQYPAQLMYIDRTGIKDDDDWVKVSGVYEAVGGEAYLTIGNFSAEFKLKRKSFFLFSIFKKREAYYYVDDVSLYPLDEQGNIQYEAPVEDTIAIAHDTVNQNLSDSILLMKEIEADSNKYIIFFKENSSVLSSNAYKTMGEISTKVFTDELYHIRIFAFRKDSEEERYAEARANNILVFLRGNAFPEEKIHILKDESGNPLYKNRAMIILELYQEETE